MEPDNHWMELRRHPNQNTQSDDKQTHTKKKKVARSGLARPPAYIPRLERGSGRCSSPERDCIANQKPGKDTLLGSWTRAQCCHASFTLSSVFYPTCISKPILTRKEASTQAYNHISSNENRYLKQACQSDIHIARTIAKQGGSINRFDCRSESSVRAGFALNLAITRLR